MNRRLGCLVLASLLIGGCRMSNKPGVQVDPFGRPQGQKLMSREQLQNRLMSFGDRYLARMAEATERLADECPNVGARERALTTRYYPSLAVVSIAADSQPEGAILDMVTVVTLERMVWGNGWADEVFGQHAPILTEAQREMENDIWTILSDVMRDREREQFRALIEKWVVDNPTRRYVTNVRFDEFASERGPAGRAAFTIDFGPAMLLAPVDETARAVTETRLLGERMTYLAARLPMLIGWQTEMVMCQLMDTREFKELLTDAERLSMAAQQMAASVKTLPADVALAQRKVIEEFDNRAQNLGGIVDKLRAGLADADRVTLNLTHGMREWKQAVDGTRDAAIAIDGMFVSADKFSSRWKPMPATAPADQIRPPSTPEGPLATSAQPGTPLAAASLVEPITASVHPPREFDVRHYGKAAEQLAEAARQLNRLADNTEKVLASRAIDQRLTEFNTSTTAWIDHAFKRGVQLILIAAVVVLLTSGASRLLRRNATST
jgi:hypothetical protein